MSQRRGPDAKPRMRERPGFGAPQRRGDRARQRMRGIRLNEEGRTTGAIRMADHSPSGWTSGVVFGVSGKQGGISAESPAVSIAWRIRNALNPQTVHRRPDCIVYDASGKAVATIDGETRERRPL